jgi:hypothetical protein
MNRTDNLIAKNRPSLRLVFVPIGYSNSEYKEFKELSENSSAYFESVAPFKTCNNKNITSVIIYPSACNISNCSDVCGSGNSSSNNCQFLIKECARNNSIHFDYVVGICKNTSCGGECGGCAEGIPGKSVIVNSQECGAQAYRIVSHELGHAMGLYHIKGPFGVNRCWDNEGGACQGPNAADCNGSNETLSKRIMAYCPTMEAYGSAAYNFLKDNSLSKFLGGCE